MTLPVGLHLGVPHAAYHADPHERPSLSSHLTGILLSSSPAHARLVHPRFGGRGEQSSPDQIENSIMHDLLLGGGAEIVEVDAKDFRTDAAKKIRDEALAAGKNPIIKRKLDQLREQAERIKKVLPFKPGVDCETETTAIWDADNGCPCRCRSDVLKGYTVYDVKIFPGATPTSADRAAAQNGWFVQAAANIEGIEATVEGACGRTKFVLAFIDPDMPEIGTIYREVRGQALEFGRKRWNRAKGLWVRCLEENTWPGMSREIEEAQCPAWMINEEMDAAIAASTQPF